MRILFRWRSHFLFSLRLGFKRGRSYIRHFTSWVQLFEIRAKVFQLFLIQATGLLGSLKQIWEVLFRKLVPFRSTHVFGLRSQALNKIALAGRNVTACSN